MKTESFFHHFRGEAIQKGHRIYGKWDVSFDYSDGKVYDIYVSDMCKPPDYKLVDLELPGKLYRLCEQHLADIQTENNQCQ